MVDKSMSTVVTRECGVNTREVQEGIRDSRFDEDISKGRMKEKEKVGCE